MEVLGVTAYILIMIIVIYTVAIAIGHWKNQMRAGSIFTFLLALSILIAAYFVVYKA